MIIIPIKWLFVWEYTLFSDKPICLGVLVSTVLEIIIVPSGYDWQFAMENHHAFNR